MKKYDKYDILISSMGYSIEGITKEIIDQNQDEINMLKEELGIKIEQDKFKLILFDDTEHTHLDVLSILVEISLGEKSMEIIREAELTGRVIIKTGEYSELRSIQIRMKEEGYKTSIRRIEKE